MFASLAILTSGRLKAILLNCFGLPSYVSNIGQESLLYVDVIAIACTNALLSDDTQLQSCTSWFQSICTMLHSLAASCQITSQTRSCQANSSACL